MNDLDNVIDDYAQAPISQAALSINENPDQAVVREVIGTEDMEMIERIRQNAQGGTDYINVVYGGNTWGDEDMFLSHDRWRLSEFSIGLVKIFHAGTVLDCVSRPG